MVVLPNVRGEIAGTSRALQSRAIISSGSHHRISRQSIRGVVFFLIDEQTMCNRYTSPAEAEIERAWHVGRDNPGRWWDEVLFPRGRGPFIRRAADDTEYSRELVVG